MQWYKRLRQFVPTALLSVILAVGSYLRLYRISEYMTFLGDEGRDMLVILHMIVNHKFTLLGPNASVGGFFLGPIYYYFMLPFVWLFRLDPSGAAVMVALFGIATIYLVYRFGHDVFDAWVGLAAAGLYALSPLVIAYSRSSWNPNPVPFFAVLLMYLLWKSVVHTQPGLLFWIGVILGIGLQLHYLFLFLFVVVGVWYLLYGRAWTWVRYYALGIAGFLVGYAPFLAFEVRHGFPNTISIVRFVLEGKDTGASSSFMTTVTDVAFRVFGRLVFRLPPPEQLGNIHGIGTWLWPASVTAVMAASLFVFALSLIRKKHPDGWQKGLVLVLIWFFVPLTLFGFYKKGIYDYYFGLFYAVPFLCTALVLRFLSAKKIGAGIAVVLLSGLLYLNWQGRPFLSTPNNQLGQMRTIAAAALSKTDGKPFNFALMTGGNSDHAYRYFFELWKRAPVTIENTAVDPDRKTVTDQLIIVCEKADCKPLGDSLWEIAGFGRADIAGQWHVSFVTIFKLVHYKGTMK